MAHGDLAPALSLRSSTSKFKQLWTALTVAYLTLPSRSRTRFTELPTGMTHRSTLPAEQEPTTTLDVRVPPMELERPISLATCTRRMKRASRS
jgi:hypothetical protein